MSLETSFITSQCAYLPRFNISRSHSCRNLYRAQKFDGIRLKREDGRSMLRARVSSSSHFPILLVNCKVSQLAKSTCDRDARGLWLVAAMSWLMPSNPTVRTDRRAA